MRVWDYQWVGGDWGEATQHATSQRHNVTWELRMDAV